MSPAPRPIRAPSNSPEFDDVDIDVQTSTRRHVVGGAEHVLHHCIQVDTLQRHEERLAQIDGKLDGLILDYREVRRVIGQPANASTGDAGTGMAKVLCDTKATVDGMAKRLGTSMIPAALRGPSSEHPPSSRTEMVKTVAMWMGLALAGGSVLKMCGEWLLWWLKSKGI
jgi:hypothetical protein